MKHRFTRDRIAPSLDTGFGVEFHRSAIQERMSAFFWWFVVLSGLVFYTMLAWLYPFEFVRLLMTLGPGVLCVVVLVGIEAKGGRRNYITALILLSAMLLPAGLFIATKSFATYSGDLHYAAPAIFGVTAIQYALLFVRLKRPLLLGFAVCFMVAAFVSLCVWMHSRQDITQQVRSSVVFRQL